MPEINAFPLNTFINDNIPGIAAYEDGFDVQVRPGERLLDFDLDDYLLCGGHRLAVLYGGHEPPFLEAV